MLLDTVGILEVSLIAVSILGANHIFLSLLLILLLRALLSDLLKVVDEALHFVLSHLFVGLDVVYHKVDSLLGLLELVLLGFFHVLLDRFSGFHSEIVFNHIDVLVDLGDFLVGIDEGQSQIARASHLLARDSLSCEDSFADYVLSADVSDLARDVGDSQLEDEVLGNF